MGEINKLKVQYVDGERVLDSEQIAFSCDKLPIVIDEIIKSEKASVQTFIRLIEDFVFCGDDVFFVVEDLLDKDRKKYAKMLAQAILEVWDDDSLNNIASPFLRGNYNEEYTYLEWLKKEKLIGEQDA